MYLKHKIKSGIVQFVALLLFFALAFGATAASTGLIGNPAEVTEKGDKSPFDQILRPPTTTTTTTTPSVSDPGNPDPPPSTGDENNPNLPTSYVTNLNNAFNTGLIEGYTSDRSKVSLSERVRLHQKLTASFGTATDAMSPATYQSYSSDAYMLAKRLQLEKDFISGSEIIIKYTREYSSKDADYTTVSTPHLIGRKTVQPYMGYLLISRVEERQIEIPVTSLPDPIAPETIIPETGEPETGIPATDAPVTDLPVTNPPATSEDNTPSEPIFRYETIEVTVISLYDRLGNLLIDDLGDKKPYFARDYSNYPVFIDGEGKYYAFTGTKFKEVGKGDLRQNLFYDYPAIPLGLYKGIYEAHYSSSLGGYHYINYKNKKSIYSSNYYRAFNYSEEGLAVVVTATDNFLQIINRSKGQVIKPGKQYVFYEDPLTGKRQNGKDFFAIPDTLGIESIGSAGFDNGYLRLRIRTTSMMSDSYGRLIQDKEFLIDTKGNKFPIPEGYTIAGYSEGIILLERNGLYGYYSIEGKWITQPIYSYARPFIQGLAVLGCEDGTMGMIDKEGNIVLPFAFSYVSDVSTGVIVTYCEGIGFETYELVAKS